MKKFEVGKRYTENGAVEFEVVKRTNEFVTVVQIQHAGRYNERRSDPKRVKVNIWNNEEVIFPTHYDELHA